MTLMNHYSMEEIHETITSRTAIKLVSEKMFLKIQQKEMDYLSSMQWKDLMIYLQNKYGEDFRRNFMEYLIDVLKKLSKEKEDETN